MSFAAIVLAAGGGDRFGGSVPKQFAMLGGLPIVTRAVRSALAGGAERVVVAVPEGRLREAERLLRDEASGRLACVPGGPTRVDSARRGLAELGAAEGIVVVHDAARPLASGELFARVVQAVAAGADAATTAVPSADTVARLEGDRLVESLDRAQHARLQTPQGFRTAVLREAHRHAAEAGDTSPTDDCGLVLRHVPGARVTWVAGEERNLKITTQLDLALAELLLGQG